jgi:hypothetical protein
MGVEMSSPIQCGVVTRQRRTHASSNLIRTQNATYDNICVINTCERSTWIVLLIKDQMKLLYYYESSAGQHSMYYSMMMYIWTWSEEPTGVGSVCMHAPCALPQPRANKKKESRHRCMHPYVGPYTCTGCLPYGTRVLHSTIAYRRISLILYLFSYFCRIRIRIISIISYKIRLDVDIINIRLKYLDMNTLSNIEYSDFIQTYLNPNSVSNTIENLLSDISIAKYT